MPRPDVAAAYPTEAQAQFSGFLITLRGIEHQTTGLEWRNETGLWQEFWRDPHAERKISLSLPPRPVLPSPLVATLLATTSMEIAGLPWSAAWRRARDLVEDHTSEFTPTPPSPDLFVHLDRPEGEFYQGKLFQISGWIFHRRSPIKRVFARVEPDGLAHVVYPKPRPDVTAVHSTPPAPLFCGFEGMIFLPAGPSAWLNLRFYAEYGDGSTVLAFSRRFFRQPADEPSAGRTRAAILLGSLALTGNYQPSSWLPWLKTLFSRRQFAPQPVPEIKPCVTVVPARRIARPVHPFECLALRENDPLISIIVPVFNTPENYLREMIGSVQAQLYPHWELCLADDASTEPHIRPLLKEFFLKDPRIRPVYRSVNGHISRASNSALAHAQGEFVALLDHDDLLAPAALLRVVESIRAHPAAEFFYTNRDKFDDTGRHFDAEERGAWNPAAAITHNYLHHLTVISHRVVLQAGAFRPDYFGSQDLDLYLRCHELLRHDQIIHVPFVAYHWRAHAGSTASRGDQKTYMFDSARRSIEDALQRRGLRASPFLPNFGLIYGMNLHQLRWDQNILREQSVSVVLAVPSASQDGWQRDLIRLCATVPLSNVQLIIVSAGKLMGVSKSVLSDNREYVVAPASTPLAELYNLGANRARHPLLLLLNTAVISAAPAWLEDLTGWLSLAGVAAVGPKLIATDGRLASAGWSIDLQTGLPHPLCANDPVEEIIPPYLSHSARDALLLDPTCVLTRTHLFRKLGGYDSRAFPTHHFTADYCLRLQSHGHRIIFSPQAVLDVSTEFIPAISHTDDEDSLFLSRYPRCRDPWIGQSAAEQSGLRSAVPAEPLRDHRSWMPAKTVEFNGGYFFLEQPYPEEELHAGHQVFSGWCLPHEEKTIAELRVRIGARIFLTDFGHPRSDLAAAVGSNQEIFPVGFTLALALPAGPTRLEFEAFFTHSGWRPVCSIDVNILPVSAATRPAPMTALTARHFADAVELLQQQTSGVSLARRAAVFARHAATLRTRRHPAKPFHGFVDDPAPNTEPIYNGLFVTGWLFHATQPIKRVAASFDLNGWIELQHENESHVIAARFPDYPQAARCAILGFVPLPFGQPRPLGLRVWAELADGSWHLVFVLRSYPHAVGLSKPGLHYGVSTWDLLRTALTLQLAHFRWRASGPGWLQLRDVMQEVRQRFPFPGPQPPNSPQPLTPTKANCPHLLCLTHNLNREGAPMFLLEIARYCHEHLATKLTIVSPVEGSLRAEFEQLGAEIRIVNRAPLWKSRTPEEYQAALNRLSRELRMHQFSLVIANTIENFWGVPLARRAGRPVLFYIHEPGVLGFHYLDKCSSVVRQGAATALGQATCASFTNRATQAYYQEFSSGWNYRIQPGWTEFSPVTIRPNLRHRARTRLRLGFAQHERVIVNVGTVCARKGQYYFVQAVEHLWKTQPALAANCRFLMIGAYSNPYGTSLAAMIARLGRPNLTLVPPTTEMHDYYAAADLFVLSSFEEGFSRVLLEAMCFALPIVSTAVHGIPEITRPGQEALLVPTADATAMATAMQQLLLDEILAAQLGQRARQRLMATYTADRVLPGHLATIRELVPELKPVVQKIQERDFLESIPAAG